MCFNHYCSADLDFLQRFYWIVFSVKATILFDSIETKCDIFADPLCERFSSPIAIYTFGATRLPIQIESRQELYIPQIHNTHMSHTDSNRTRSLTYKYILLFIHFMVFIPAIAIHVYFTYIYTRSFFSRPSEISWSGLDESREKLVWRACRGESGERFRVTVPMIQFH